MLIDMRLTWPIIVLLFLSCLFPVLDALNIFDHFAISVRVIENIQALLLLFFAIFSYFFMKPFTLENGQKHFWFWAVCWWILLFGRSTSWGRDYFPEVPKIYFRAISIVLIALVVFPLLNVHLRREIALKFKTAAISIWGITLVFIGLIVSDAIEHNRAIAPVFLHNPMHKDLMEELFEFPLIIGLFLVAFSLMKVDKKA